MGCFKKRGKEKSKQGSDGEKEDCAAGRSKKEEKKRAVRVVRCCRLHLKCSCTVLFEILVPEQFSRERVVYDGEKFIAFKFSGKKV